MDYDGWETSYLVRQVGRIGRALEKLNASEASLGRVVPDDDTLAIGDGRRLGMAVMFLDICGFSQRPLETDSEQGMMLRVLNLFFSEMIKIAEDYGGTIEKNTGDGLMAYFEDGAGTPAEDGVKRAVACALTMMAANSQLISPILLSSQIPEIRYRITIDYGHVTVARLGAARRHNAMVAIGTTANVAAKMLSKATAGEILLGEKARARLPFEWGIAFIELATTDSGWVYRATGKPYPLYRYTGRWKTPR